MLGFLFKHRGAVAAPDVEWSRPLASTWALFKSPWYALGLGVAMASWGFHVTALALAPISLVQSITQIQEQTLTFVPKIAAMMVAAIVLMPWIGHELLTYAAAMFATGELPVTAP